MSLQVWLPMTSQEIENKGIKILDFSTSIAMQLEDGKIGKCYYRNNVGVIRSNKFNVNSTTEGSICLWLKMPADYTANGYIGGLSAGTAPNFMLYNYGATSIRIYIDGSYRLAHAHGLAAEEWHHIAATFNSTGAALYIDGIQVKTAEGNWTIPEEERIMIGGRSNSDTGSSSALRNNYYNDFRYYDHCLSPLEVKEISQGLIAHWTFTEQSIIGGQVSDASGYGNYLNIIGGTIDTDTARYSTSINFTDGQYAISPRQCGDWLPKEQMTVNLWTKWTTWNRPISCTETGGWNFEQGNTSDGIQFPVYLNTANSYKIARSKIAYSNLTNGWHMFTGVFDGTSVKIYIDGIEPPNSSVTFSADTIKYGNNVPLVISGEAKASLTTPQNSLQEGNISDVRIYCTPLLDNDIKLLYNNSMRIDNLNNVHTYEFIEQNENTQGTPSNASYTVNSGSTVSETATIYRYTTATSTYPNTQMASVTTTRYTKKYSQFNFSGANKYTISSPSISVAPINKTYTVKKWTGTSANHSSTSTTYYLTRYYYESYLYIYDNEDNLIKTITLQSLEDQSTSTTQSGTSTSQTCAASTETIELPYDVLNAAYGIIAIKYESSQVPSNTSNSSKRFSINSTPLTVPSPVKITRKGQFYNRIIDSNSWINQKVSFVRDGQIIAKDFIEM